MDSVSSDLISTGKPCWTSFYDDSRQRLEVVEDGWDVNWCGLRTPVHVLHTTVMEK